MRLTNLFKILGLSAALAMPLVGCDDEDKNPTNDGGPRDGSLTDVKPPADGPQGDAKVTTPDAQQGDAPTGDARTGDTNGDATAG